MMPMQGSHVPEPRMTGVIVTYKSSDTIAACLAGARRCVDAGFMRLLVVDNASPDDTRRILAREADFARVILGEANIGFGRGCNRGLREAVTPYVLFINPDATIEPDAVRILVSFLDLNPGCALCGPAIRTQPGRVQEVGGLSRPWTFVGDALGMYASMHSRTPVVPGTAPFRTDWISGAMLCGRTDVLKALGGFDPRFFLYFEETDLCRRVMGAGHEIWCVPAAQVHHVGGVSAAQESGDRVRGCIATHYYQSRHYYLRRHFGVLAAYFTDAVELLALPMQSLFRGLLGKPHAPILQRWRHPLWTMPVSVNEERP